MFNRGLNFHLAFFFGCIIISRQLCIFIQSPNIIDDIFNPNSTSSPVVDDISLKQFFQYQITDRFDSRFDF